MTMSNVQGSWNVGRASGTCAACGVELTPGMECWAALCDRPPEPRAEPASEPEKGKKAAEPVAPSPFVRIDFGVKCWDEGKRPGDGGQPMTMFSFWKTTVPTPQHKKKLLVDDSVLVDVFQRMEGKNEPQEVRFRFVLALILMRKRLLKYEGMEEAQKQEASSQEQEGTKAPEVWRMVPRGSEAAVQVINPHLTEEQIAEVSQQLSAILAEEV
jgi:hypothetical protein